MTLTTARIAWRNLGRNRKRTVLAVTAIALGQLIVVFVNGMMAGMFEQLLNVITGPLVGHVQVHHPEWTEERASDLTIDNLENVLAEIRRLPEVEEVHPRVYSGALVAPKSEPGEASDAEAAMVVGVDPESAIAQGGMLDGLEKDKAPGDHRVAVGDVLANRLGIAEGQEIAVIGQDRDGFPAADLYTVSAVVRSGVDMINSMGVVMAIDDAQTLLALPNKAHELIIRGGDPRDADALAKAVSGLEAIGGYEVLSWREAKPELVRIIDMKAYIDVIFLIIVFIAASAGIANTMMMSTFERIHEFGMLLALGTNPRRLVRMILIEAVILGIIGVAVGSALGVGIVWATGQTGINYAAISGIQTDGIAFEGILFSYVIYPQIEVKHVLYGLIAVSLTSIFASLWPAALAARLEPAEALRS